MKSWLCVAALLLAGCSASTPAAVQGAAAMQAQAADAGCLVQVPAAMADSTPNGTLEVHVVDEHGALLPAAAVQAIGPNEHYQLQCLPGINAQTSGDGVARLERLKTGSYLVSAFLTYGDKAFSGRGKAQVATGKATVVTLTVTTLP